MNKKGFTLVELLATLVVLGIVMGISIVGIGTSLENGKKKSEKEFLSQLSNAVDAYMTLCLGKYSVDASSCSEFAGFPDMSNDTNDSNKYGVITKNNNRKVNVYKSSEVISFDNILNENILVGNDLINPVNSKNCGNGSKITFYRDYDYVYYYEIVLPQSCIKYLDYNSNKITTLLSVTNKAAGSVSLSDMSRSDLNTSGLRDSSGSARRSTSSSNEARINK